MRNIDPPHSPSPPSHAQKPDAEPPPPPRLLDQVRNAIRVRHYSIRTEAAYTDWARRFILFHGKRHPSQRGAPEVAAFLNVSKCPEPSETAPPNPCAAEVAEVIA